MVWCEVQARKPLRGQPLPRGRHTRFSKGSAAIESPTASACCCVA